MLDEVACPLAAILYFDLCDEIAAERLRARALEEGRTDDTPDAIRKRLELYHERTEPLIAHYLPTGKVVGIHADGSIDAVFAEIQAALEQAAVRTS